MNKSHTAVDNLRTELTNVDQRVREPALRFRLTSRYARIRLGLGPVGHNRRHTDDDCTLSNAFGDRKRLLDLCLVNEQGRTQTVEPLRLSIAGQVLERLEHQRVHVQKIANAVGELDPIETSHGNPPACVVSGSFCFTQPRVDPINNGFELAWRRPRFILGRHRAQVDHVHDLFPLLRHGGSAEIGRQLVDTESGVRLFWTMAASAVTGKKRLDLLSELVMFDFPMPRFRIPRFPIAQFLRPRVGVCDRVDDEQKEQQSPKVTDFRCSANRQEATSHG